MSGTDNQVLIPVCPGCKTTHVPRFKALTIAMTCHSCGTYFNLGPWSKDAAKFNFKAVPDLAIGSRGKLNDVVYEVTGFVVKEDNRYHFKWREYSLYNPTFGLAYLSENNGHWNFMRPVRAPFTRIIGMQFNYDNNLFQLYSKMKATVIFGQGEFFMDVVDTTEQVLTEEYLSVPELFVRDADGQSVHWFRGSYMPSDIVSGAFNIPKDKMPKKEGRGYTQPFVGSFSPSALILTSVLLGALVILVQLFVTMNAAEKIVYANSFQASELKDGQKMFVSTDFHLDGGEQSVVITINSPIDNDWFYGDFTLINNADQTEYDFSKEIEYYYGRTDGESWSEGSRVGEAFISSVPGGEYHINIYPQFGAATQFNLDVTRDVPSLMNMFIALFVLALFPVIFFIWRYQVEKKRWEDSDYSPYDSE